MLQRFTGFRPKAERRGPGSPLPAKFRGYRRALRSASAAAASFAASFAAAAAAAAAADPGRLFADPLRTPRPRALAPRPLLSGVARPLPGRPPPPPPRIVSGVSGTSGVSALPPGEPAPSLPDSEPPSSQPPCTPPNAAAAEPALGGCRGTAARARLSCTGAVPARRVPASLAWGEGERRMETFQEAHQMSGLHHHLITMMMIMEMMITMMRMIIIFVIINMSLNVNEKQRGSRTCSASPLCPQQLAAAARPAGRHG